MDIEGAEFGVLRQFVDSALASGAPLPDQISLEVHAASGGAVPGDPAMMSGRGGLRFDGSGLSPLYRSVKSPGELALFGHYLFAAGGYLIADRRDHPVCDACTELALVRVFCAGSGGLSVP
mmetsp:Transcript_32902/g.74285  ORF Transcript_32902/g.74285 Transcript_32902/m.74285 type:complete len:121 (-) Transcript_32902:181-543(-)